MKFRKTLHTTTAISVALSAFALPMMAGAQTALGIAD